MSKPEPEPEPDPAWPELEQDTVWTSVGVLPAAEVVALTRGLLQRADPFKNRVVLINRDLWTVRSCISDRAR